MVARARSAMSEAQIDARLQDLGLLERIDGSRLAEDAQRVRAFALRGRELPELDVRLADALIGERDALLIGQGRAEDARLLELGDRAVVVAHLLEDLTAHETRHGQRHGRAVLAIPIDLLLIERERLAVIAHAAHHERQRVRRHDVRLRSLAAAARAIRLRQRNDGQILAPVTMLEQPAVDEQARIGLRAGRLRGARRLDGLDGGRDARRCRRRRSRKP